MALQTATVVNGEWTTQTLDVNAILQHYNEEDRQAMTSAAQDVEKAPVLGLLTQTVLRSPLAHWILPVHLRGTEYDDVAFIGVSDLFLRCELDELLVSLLNHCLTPRETILRPGI